MVKTVLTFVICLCLMACQSQKPSSLGIKLKTKTHRGLLDGWWLSEGYGYLIYSSASQARFFNITDRFCMEEDLGGELIDDMYTYFRLSPSQDRVEFFGDYDPYPYQYTRIANQPDFCARPPDDTPISNFEAFASLFDTHYAFFNLYQVDWSSRVDQYRKEISADTTDRELYDVFTTMLTGINDAHIDLTAVVDGKTLKFDAYPGKIEPALKRLAQAQNLSVDEASNQFHNHYWSTEIKTQILGGQGHVTGNGRIQYGMLDNSLIDQPIGYVALVSVGAALLTPEQRQDNWAKALDQALEPVIKLFNDQNVHAVIIDLSINYGGYDFISRKVAEHFTRQPTLTYVKRAADSIRSKPHQYTLIPAQTGQYTGPVYVLTSHITVSGGETLTMGLKSLPQVTHVGEATRGALSDKLSKTLPNGWEVSLSNEVYLDHKNQAREGVGITPSISFPVFDWNDLTKGHIDAIREVVAVIESS